MDENAVNRVIVLHQFAESLRESPTPVNHGRNPVENQQLLDEAANEAPIVTVNKQVVRANTGNPDAAQENAAASQTEYLKQRAKEIHEAQSKIAQSKTTTAVGKGVTENGESVTLVASSNARLSPKQRSALKAGETPIKNQTLNLKSNVKIHAEHKITLYARLNNIKLEEVAPSRPACPSCVIHLDEAGAKLAGEAKQVKAQTQTQ
jgi:hypothetical protein